MQNIHPTRDAKADMRWRCRSHSKKQVHKEGTENSLYFCITWYLKFQSKAIQIFALSFYEARYQKLWVSTMCLWLYFEILQFEWHNMKDYVCNCNHGTTSLWYFCYCCSFLKLSCSVCFVICVWKYNMLLEILIICVIPHILFISVYWIYSTFCNFILFSTSTENSYVEVSIMYLPRTLFDSPIQKKNHLSPGHKTNDGSNGAYRYERIKNSLQLKCTIQTAWLTFFL